MKIAITTETTCDLSPEQIAKNDIKVLPLTVILGEKSKINAKPILIIDCDDVHASHGCAIGTLDDNEIYYLMSRGISRKKSINLLMKSFLVNGGNEDNNIVKEYIEFLKMVKLKHF